MSSHEKLALFKMCAEKIYNAKSLESFYVEAKDAELILKLNKLSLDKLEKLMYNKSEFEVMVRLYERHQMSRRSERNERNAG